MTPAKIDSGKWTMFMDRDETPQLVEDMLPEDEEMDKFITKQTITAGIQCTPNVSQGQVSNTIRILSQMPPESPFKALHLLETYGGRVRYCPIF